MDETSLLKEALQNHRSELEKVETELSRAEREVRTKIVLVLYSMLLDIYCVMKMIILYFTMSRTLD